MPFLKQLNTASLDSNKILFVNNNFIIITCIHIIIIIKFIIISIIELYIHIENYKIFI